MMFFHSKLTPCWGLCVLVVLLPAASAETVFESCSGTMEEIRAAIADLAVEGRSYLGRLAGEQTVRSVHKAFTQVLGVVAEGFASGLNVVLQHLSSFLKAAGIQVFFPVTKVTPEGVIFVAQWVFIALIGYWLFSLALRLVASTLRRAMWLLKVVSSVACFVFILRDHSVGTETMAIRLTILVCVCVLLGVGTSNGPTASDKAVHLEKQVKVLERRLREMERWTKSE